MSLHRSLGLLIALGAALLLVPGARGGSEPAASQEAESLAETCIYVNDPALFHYSPEEAYRERSEITGAVVQFLRPVISRSAPMLPSPRNNFIDEHVFGRIEAAGIEPAPLASDAEFLRRVKLDLTGRIPSADEVVAFIEDPSTIKREALIDSLVASPEFADKWTMFFGDLLRINARSTNVNRFTQGRDAFYLYLKDSIRQNKPYDQLGRELLTATGDNHTVGAANFTVGGIIPMGPPQDTYDGMAAQVASMFMGIQVVDCLLCHDGANRLESVNLWGARQTRLNMWGLSAFFAETGIRAERISDTPRLIRFEVFDAPSRRTGYFLNTDDGNRSPRLPVGEISEVEPAYPFTLDSDRGGGVSTGANRRQALADFITSDIQFARASVNYIWEEMMVVALVSPSNGFDLDRLSPTSSLPEPWTSQPTNPELLEALAGWFRDNNYDLRALTALIAKSRAYQLSSRYPTEWREEYVPYYARHYARRLDAEEIHDAVLAATGVGATYEIRSRTGTLLGPVGWAMQLPDTKEPLSNRRIAFFLDAFGRGDRDQTVRSSDGSALQALNLMNHTFVNSRISASSPTSTLGRILAETSDPATIIREVYLATLSRYPEPDETALLMPVMEQLGNSAGAESVQWMLINKLDFVFNY